MLLILGLAAGIGHAEDQGLTIDHILDSEWEWHSPKSVGDWPRYSLCFYEDGAVSAHKNSSQMDAELYAVWEAAGPRQIVLRYVECIGDELPPEEDGEIVFTTTARGEIRRLEDSVDQEYAIYLSDGWESPSLVLLSGDFTVRPNLRRKVNGVEVITLGGVGGMTTQNVRVRVAPSIQAGIIRFPTRDYRPKGSYVRVLARTLQRERVQQWTNYWYYVENTGERQSARYGWMFGEFVAISEEEVHEAATARRP